MVFLEDLLMKKTLFAAKSGASESFYGRGGVIREDNGRGRKRGCQRFLERTILGGKHQGRCKEF